MEPDEIRDPTDLLAYILTHESDIYVMHDHEPVALTWLPPRVRAEKIMRFLREGGIPIRSPKEDLSDE